MIIIGTLNYRKNLAPIHIFVQRCRPFDIHLFWTLECKKQSVAKILLVKLNFRLQLQLIISTWFHIIENSILP